MEENTQYQKVSFLNARKGRKLIQEDGFINSEEQHST